MKSKTIILSSNDKKSRGILTIFMQDELLQCKIRLYNISKLNDSCKIGLYHNNQVYTANLLNKQGVYLSSFVGDFDIDKDFYCAIIDTNESNNVILSGGTYAGFYFNDNSVFDKEFDRNETLDRELETEIDNALVDYDENETLLSKPQDLDCENFEMHSKTDKPSYNEKPEHKTDELDKCAKCKYKEFFYNNENTNVASANTSNQTPIENISNDTSIKNANNRTQNETSADKTAENNKVFEKLLPQLNYIFENYEENTELTTLINNAKFVHINDRQDSYSIGAIYENDKIKYICYAIKCNYNENPPEEIGKNYQWLPLDADDPLSEGYYLVYQDALDLKILEF